MFTFVKLPSDLSARNFNEWHSKICAAAKNIGLSAPVSDDLMISFSDTEKTRIYGSLSVEEAKNKIRERWNISERANDLLDGLQTPEDFHESQLASPLAEEISAANRDRKETYESVRAQLEDIFDMVAFKQLVLGEYIHPQIIVLYTKNIEHTQHTPGETRTLEQIYEEVFAHEMFHAYHYQNEPEELVERMDYTSRVVKESLAAAFEWAYCVENKIPKADDLRYEWDRYSVITYPYSGAKHLLQPIPHKAMVCLDKTAFCDIFHISLVDMDRALRLLLAPEEFYKIKNLVRIRKIEVPAPAGKMPYDDYAAKFTGKKIGLIAQEEIPPLLARKPHLVADLLNDLYSHKTFGISHALLSATQVCYPCGDRAYYTKTIVNAAGSEYYLFMHWRERHREDLLKWLWTNSL